jgi:anaerobic magnesium-protoporphyrin IX monomethyl ester cyclase
MDVVFISTDLDTWALGMRSISAVLRAAGYHTRLLFMVAEDELFSEKQLLALASLVEDTGVIGISCLAKGSDKAKQIINFLRPLNKLIVWGGVHACLNVKDCVERVDIVCQGEGEGMMLDLIESITLKKDWRNIENIAYMENGELKQNSLRPPIKNLDELPFPDFTFEEEYHLSPNGFISNGGLFYQSKVIVFNSSRGCAFHCTYCCNSKLKNQYAGQSSYVRRMSTSKLIEHSQKLRKIFPVAKYFFFIDEDFTLRSTEELKQLSVEFSEKVGLPFECCAHPARVNHEKMDLLVKSGLMRIRMGIESGSENTKREIYKRFVSNEVVLKATKVISTFPQLANIYFIIIANPYETSSDLLDTVELLARLPYGSNIQVFNLIFFPGSAIYERAVKDDLIEGENDSGKELDYRGGLVYKKHSWKRKNLYLNGIIYLMEGRITQFRLGSLPRFMLKALILPRILNFNEQYSFIVKVIIFAKEIIIFFRHLGARILRKIIGNPLAVYNFGYYIKKSIFRKKLISQ